MDVSRLSRQLAKLGMVDEPVGDAPRAVVAAILRQRPLASSADLLFIRRAERATDPWSGHIAFPGGRCDATDAGLLATAIRETKEEVGIDLSPRDAIARLPDVPAFVRTGKGPLVVTPYVFALPSEGLPRPNEEVAEAIWYPFDELASGQLRGTYAFRWKDKDIELPCMRLEPGAHVLWGMTFRMVETILEALAAT